jgi:Tol biopolymer transport system component
MRHAAIVTLAAILAGSLLAAPGSQERTSGTAGSPESVWADAADDWQSGRYPDALASLTALASGPSSADFHDRIALLTGDLYSTLEITTDGRSPRVSRTGEYVMYETGPAGRVTTRVVRTRPGLRQIAELPTTIAAFDPAGTRLAWVRFSSQAPDASDVVILDLPAGTEQTLAAPGLVKSALAWNGQGNGIFLVASQPGDATRSDIYLITEAQPASVRRLTDTPGLKTGLMVDPGGSVLVYSSATGGGGRGAGGSTPPEATVFDLEAGTTRVVTGALAGSLTMSADGSTLAWIAPAADSAPTLFVSPRAAGSTPTAVRAATGAARIGGPALSPDGRLVAYQLQTRVGSSTDWDIYVSDRSGTHRRITRDIQHDVLPRFLSNGTLLGLIGEPRHRRAHLYDLASGARTRLFTNNTIRTISPEYAWVPSADGTHLAIQADRDGDTISPQRGIYLIDLTRKVTAGELARRLDAQRAAENDLRTRMTAAYQPLAADIRAVVSRISTNRIFDCHRAQADFDSKHVTQPGNAKAIEHLQRTYASYGFKPEVQSFAFGRGGQPGSRTANVVATLRGTANPDLIYVASSHFDSVTSGPGADDNTSGTCALLEAARVLSGRPLPATVVFASFTGEEAGLLGSEEFVRLARERNWQVAGALNNDMIGWAADGGRVDNTIRYSNRGIRDLQHGAAFLFTELVTYDAHYFYGTDAATFHEAWGDIFAGIGSYPILANPNYHQPSDLIETISFRQVAETAKVTAATLVALASSPSRVKNLKAARENGQAVLTWTPAVESGVTHYIVAYGPPASPLGSRMSVKTARAALASAPAGTHVAVKAVNARGLESWDWARAVVD